MSRISQIRNLVLMGRHYLTQHADEEATTEGLDIYDVEYAILTGKVRRTWPRQHKYEVVGPVFDGRAMGLVCRVTTSNRLCIITVYEDRPKE